MITEITVELQIHGYIKQMHVTASALVQSQLMPSVSFLSVLRHQQLLVQVHELPINK